MSLRRLSPREYVVNLVAVTVADGRSTRRREWADRGDAWIGSPCVARSRWRSMPGRPCPSTGTGIGPPASIRRPSATGPDFARLPLIDKADVRDGCPDALAGRGTRPLDAASSRRAPARRASMMSIPHRADRFWPYLLSSQRILRWAAGGRYPFWWRQAYVYTSEYPLLRVPGFYPLTFIPTAADPDRILDALEALRPHLLHTYPSVLRDLVGHWRRTACGRCSLHGVSVGSELSTQAERDGWEALLGAPVRDEYSSEELGRIASQCPEGRYHLHEDIVKTEIVDADGQPTDGVGEVVGTELHNRTMPFVRYRQGDLARISDEPCRCGRQTRLLVDLVGRRNDGFLLDGRAALSPPGSCSMPPTGRSSASPRTR